MIVSYLEEARYTWVEMFQILEEWVELKVQHLKVGSHSFYFGKVETWIIEQIYKR